MKALALLLLISASSTLAAPGCEEEPANLLAGHNCAFAVDLEGWINEDQEGTTKHDPKQGSASPGAMAVTGPEGSAVIFAPCVAVKFATKYHASARVRAAAGVKVYSCGLTVREFTDAICGEGRDFLDLSAAVVPNSEWQTAGGEATTGPKAASVRLHLECTGEPGLRAWFDDVRFATP